MRCEGSPSAHVCGAPLPQSQRRQSKSNHQHPRIDTLSRTFFLLAGCSPTPGSDALARDAAARHISLPLRSCIILRSATILVTTTKHRSAIASDLWSFLVFLLFGVPSSFPCRSQSQAPLQARVIISVGAPSSPLTVRGLVIVPPWMFRDSTMCLPHQLAWRGNPARRGWTGYRR
jgi:hypothetical protein